MRINQDPVASGEGAAIRNADHHHRACWHRGDNRPRLYGAQTAEADKIASSTNSATTHRQLSGHCLGWTGSPGWSVMPTRNPYLPTQLLGPAAMSALVH
jgi:hypothetical protein